MRAVSSSFFDPFFPPLAGALVRGLELVYAFGHWLVPVRLCMKRLNGDELSKTLNERGGESHSQEGVDNKDMIALAGSI